VFADVVVRRDGTTHHHAAPGASRAEAAAVIKDREAARWRRVAARLMDAI